MKPASPARDCITGSDLALPLVDSIRTLSSHDSTRLTWHAHEGYELIFVLQGATTYELQKGGTIELRTGHFVFIPPGVSHRGAHDARSPVNLCGILFDPHRRDALKNAPVTATELKAIRSKVSSAGVTLRPCTYEMRTEVEQLVHEKNARLDRTKDDIVWAVIRTLACKAIIEAVRLLDTSEDQREQTYVSAAKQYLQRRIEQPFCMTDLVRQLGISRTRLYTLFKAETGLTPNDFLVRCRIEQAQRLLAQSDRNITDIAFDVGFNSSQYFSRAFWRYTGRSPRTFRRNFQSGIADRQAILPSK